MNRPTNPREIYIAAAARRFAADGYHGTSLATLAKDVGVSKQAILHFFGTKQKLYGEVLTAAATQQCAQVQACAQSDPVAHLQAYFQAFGQADNSEPDNARLIIRALLDSPERARNWPMKPYLQRLVVLVQSTPGGKDFDRQDAIAWVFQMIGAIHYFAISTTAIAGMYGNAPRRKITQRFGQMIADRVAELAT